MSDEITFIADWQMEQNRSRPTLRVLVRLYKGKDVFGCLEEVEIDNELMHEWLRGRLNASFLNTIRSSVEIAHEEKTHKEVLAIIDKTVEQLLVDFCKKQNIERSCIVPQVL